MTTYEIFSKNGDSFGTFQGDSPAAALLAMHRDAGVGPDQVWLNAGDDDISFADEDVERAAGGLDAWRVVAQESL